MYIEKDAKYLVQIPEEYRLNEDTPEHADFETNRYRKYWNGKVIQVSEIREYKNICAPGLCIFVSGHHGEENEGRRFDIPATWLAELVEHCPQVKHYIKNQQKENYTSPFTGKTS